MSAVVMTNVPPNTLVAGNPARQVRSLGKNPPAKSGLEEVATKKHA